LRVFEPEEKFRSEGGSGNGGGDDRPAEWSDDGISEEAAEREVDAEGDDVGESFEEKMRVDRVGAEVEVDRKACGMGRRDDGELYLGLVV
jgi:hypothetical protein